MVNISVEGCHHDIEMVKIVITSEGGLVRICVEGGHHDIDMVKIVITSEGGLVRISVEGCHQDCHTDSLGGGLVFSEQ